MEKSKPLMFDEGVVSDYEFGTQVGSFISDMLNARIISYEKGMFVFRNVKGVFNAAKSGFPSNSILCGGCQFEGGILVMLRAGNASHIGKITETEHGKITYENMITDPDSSVFKFDAEKIIKRVVVNRENIEMLGIYWIDGISAPKGFRYYDGITIDEINAVDFDFETGYASVMYSGCIPGALPAGSYFYAVRLLTKFGTYTDWSAVMGPVTITHDLASADNFASMECREPGLLTNVGNRLKVIDINQEFVKIEVACFYGSTDINQVTSGYIFKRDDILGQTDIVIDHISDVSFDTVTVQQALNGRFTVFSAQDMAIVRNQLTLVNVELSNDMPLLGNVKRNKIENVAITHVQKKAEFDSVGDSQDYADHGLSNNIVDSVLLQGGELIRRSKFQKNSSTGNEEEIITCENDFANYAGLTLSTLAKTAIRGEKYRIGILPIYKGKKQAVRWVGDIEFPQCETSPLIEKRVGIDGYDMNILLAKLSNIDFTEYVNVDVNGNPLSCSIDGFHIVVAPREGSWLSEGILMPGGYHTSNYRGNTKIDTSKDFSEYGLILAPTDDFDTAHGMELTRINKMYQYYTPDKFRSSIINSPTKIRIERQHEGIYQRYLPHDDIDRGYNAMYDRILKLRTNYKGGCDNISASVWTLCHYDLGGYVNLYGLGTSVFQKYYNTPQSYGGDLRIPQNHEILDIVKRYIIEPFNPLADFDSQAIYVKELGNRKFINAYHGFRYGDEDNDNKVDFGCGAACELIVTEDEGEDSFACYQKDAITVVSMRSGHLSDYGGTSDASLSKTKYMTCWHYQPINLDVLQKIKTPDGRFIFNNVEVFIGDAYIIPYSINRIFRGTPAYWDDPEKLYYAYTSSHSEVVPIQSIANYIHREQDTWLKKKSLRIDSKGEILGIGAFSLDKTEKSYISVENTKMHIYQRMKQIGNTYITLSPDIIYPTNFPLRAIWTDKKIPGEEYDTFMNFPITNYIDLQGNLEYISACGFVGDKLFAFCNGGIAVMPIDERVVIPGEREYEMSSKSGISRYDVIPGITSLSKFDYFSFIETPYGFVWFDRKNLDWILFSGNEAPVSIPTSNKFRSYFEDMFFRAKHMEHNKIYSNIRCWYDPNHREILIGYIFSDEGNMAIAFNVEAKKFMGRRNSDAEQFQFIIDQTLYHLQNTANIPIKFLSLERYSSRQVEINFSINDLPDSEKCFTNMRLNGCIVTPDYISYQTDIVKEPIIQNIGITNTFERNNTIFIILPSKKTRSFKIDRINGSYLNAKLYFSAMTTNNLLSIRSIEVFYENEKY